jgi:hypothetical protein
VTVGEAKGVGQGSAPGGLIQCSSTPLAVFVAFRSVGAPGTRAGVKARIGAFADRALPEMARTVRRTGATGLGKR